MKKWAYFFMILLTLGLISTNEPAKSKIASDGYTAAMRKWGGMAAIDVRTETYREQQYQLCDAHHTCMSPLNHAGRPQKISDVPLQIEIPMVF